MMNEKIKHKKQLCELKRVLKKWNYSKHYYEPYMIPISWNCKTYCDDMDEAVNCVQCGRAIRFGEGYTSFEIQTGVGFGYCVCPACHEKEYRKYYQEKVGKNE